MNTLLKSLFVPFVGAVLAGSGAAVSGVDPTPYATEIGAGFGALFGFLFQSLRAQAAAKNDGLNDVTNGSAK